MAALPQFMKVSAARALVSALGAIIAGTASNIASIVHGGAGLYTITFTTAIPGLGAGLVWPVLTLSGGGNGQIDGVALSDTQVLVSTFNGTGVAADRAFAIDVGVYRQLGNAGLVIDGVPIIVGS